MPQEASAVEWNKAYLNNLGKEENELHDDNEDVEGEKGEKHASSDTMMISVNQYEVISKIGHGCVGEIYHVRDTSKTVNKAPHMEYVLKTYPGDNLEKKATRSSGLNKDLLANEIKQLTALSHPHIIGLKEVIRDSKFPHSTSLVYEYADAGPLMHVTMGETDVDQYYAVLVPTFTVRDTDSHFNEKEAGFVFCQILDALGHLQAHHIAHRNIQMSNILMTQQGQVKLIGFELSHDYSANVGDEETYGLTVETPGVWPLWSPEMCLSSVSGAPYSAFKADLWAISVILYTMVCGKLPFWDSDPGVLFQQIIAITQSKSSFEFPVTVSQPLQELFESLFSPNEADRPTAVTCRQMEWLAPYSKQPLVLASPPSAHTAPVTTTGHSKYKKESTEDSSKKKNAQEAQNQKKIKEKKIKHKLFDANGHNWQPKYFNKPTWCRICDDFVFGLTMDMQKAYKCRECKMSGHLKCVLNYNDHMACSKSNTAEGGMKAPVPKFTLNQNSAPVPNVSGHVWRKKKLKSPTWCKVCNSFIFGVTKEQQNAYKCLLCKTIGHRDCCEFYNDHGCSIGQFGADVIKHNSTKKRPSKVVRAPTGEITQKETLAMINQYEISQEYQNKSTFDQANLTVVVDTTDPEKSSFIMRSYPGEKLKVPPFVFKRRDMTRQSEADLIHLEIELMRKMVHPNLQMIRDVISETVAPNNVHMVLELVDGGQILDSMPNQDENLSPLFRVPGTEGVYVEEMASVIFRQLLSALVYLQRNHIAHRDLKPENVLITLKGVVKLTEFGESTDFNKRSNSAGAQDGMVTDMKGTWLFWAPEVCEDTVDDEDTAPYCAYTADVWAAGVILHTMMMGSLPFWHVEPDSLFELITSTQTKPFQPSYPEGISDEYREILEAMLTPDPAMRPSFEVCESFEWLQKHSNAENESKLNEASNNVMIPNKDFSYSYTPGDAFYLAEKLNTESQGDSAVNSETGQSVLYKTPSDHVFDGTADEDLTPEEKKAKLLPPEDVNGHEWKSKFLNKPTFCKICKSFIWGLTEEQQGAYKCKCCKTVGHRHCCKELNASTECVPVESSSSNIFKEELSTFQKKSLGKMISKPEMNWNLLRGASKKDGFSDVVVDVVKAGLHPPPNVNGHVWRSKYLTKPTWCKVCDSFIFGVTTEQQNAYKCFLCKMSAHRDCCIRHNEHACMGGRKSDKHLQVDTEEESKEKLAMINQYEVLKELGRGAYGKVYLITDSTSSTRMQYAMKTFPGAKMKAKKLGRFANKGPSEADLIRFEIQIMKNMSHPNVVALTDAIEESVAPNNVHLVLELVDGGQILDSKPNDNEDLSPLFFVPGTDGVYDERIASVIFRQLLAALVYLERNHIAHRDLKPENVLITKKGVVKLTDFGVSSDFTTASTEDERNGMIADTKGTWPFWSPEMCDETVEDGTKFSAYTADVWAAGVILYTMMMGSLPFWHVEPDSLFELITATQKQPLEPSYPEGISDEYREILEAMLTPDPAMRPSFEVCESFEWLQNHSNAENEKKLNAASASLIDREKCDKELVFTPGNSYFLVADENNTTGSFYKPNSSNKLGANETISEKTETEGQGDNESHETVKVKEPPEDVNGHEWKRTFLNKPTWCKICKSFVWGLTEEQQGAYKCKCCKTFGHRHCCIKLNESPCQARGQVVRSNSRSVVDLEDANGHAWHEKCLTKPRWCDICETFIYVANKHEQYAYKCSQCKTVGHKECCVQRNQSTCAGGERGGGRTRRKSFAGLSLGGNSSPSPSPKQTDGPDSFHTTTTPTSSLEDAEGTTPGKKRAFGSGILQRLSLVTRTLTKSTEKDDKDEKQGTDNSV